VAVCVFAFDALIVGGESVMALPLRQRRAALAAALPGCRSGYVELAASVEVPPAASNGAEGVEEVFEEQQQEQQQVEEQQQQQQQERLSGNSDDEAMSDGDGAGTQQQQQAQQQQEQMQEDEQREQLEQQQEQIEIEQQPGQQEQEQQQQQQQQQRSDEEEDGEDGEDGGNAREARVFSFFKAALRGGAEGLMLKRLDGAGAAYAPAKRANAWVKLKKDYVEGLADSFDVVPIGAWRGQGRKTAWLSPFLLAVYDPDSGEFQSLCRCMSGFSDSFYVAATERLMETAVPNKPAYYNTGENCSVWFSPSSLEVWQIRGADLTLSPVHRAAAGLVDVSGGRGIGLRFPRFIALRPDKRPEDASGPDLVAQLYLAQTRRRA
jgi:DNA ligase-1